MQKRFKQSKDNCQAVVGAELSATFVEITDECTETADSGMQKTSKAVAFDKWSTCICSSSSDNGKCGVMKSDSQEQHSSGDNQHPKTLTTGADVLTNHAWDPACEEHTKRKRQNKMDSKKNSDTEEGTQSQQDTSRVDCFCCGKKGRCSNDYAQKDVVAKENWKSTGTGRMGQKSVKRINRRHMH